MATRVEDGLEEAARLSLAGAIRYHHEKSESSEKLGGTALTRPWKHLLSGAFFVGLKSSHLAAIIFVTTIYH